MSGECSASPGMSKACCVCNEPKESKDNVIFTCKGQGCDVSVHQGENNRLGIPCQCFYLFLSFL